MKFHNGHILVLHSSYLAILFYQVLSSPERLLLRDPDADLGGVDDMTKLAYLNEPGVLYNLERRYALDSIYVSELYLCK